jgi:hypothetical protein
MIWISFRKCFGNCGRIGRSINRPISVSRSLARPSRLRNPPGIRPYAPVRIHVVAGEREEVAERERVLGRDDRREDRAVILADDDGAVGLLGEVAGFRG